MDCARPALELVVRHLADDAVGSWRADSFSVRFRSHCRLPVAFLEFRYDRRS